MKVLIATDMEGITGVTTWDHVTPGHVEYQRFRKLMTEDVNAAIRGCLQAGVDEFVVCDGHWNGGNILIEDLDPHARLISGTSSPFSMVQGVDTGVAAALLVGYHARRGAQNAILDHTWSSVRVANLWLNGKLTGEIGLNAAVCAHFDVPVVMISGDQTACQEAAELIDGIEVAVIKQARSRMSAECLAVEAAHQRIREAAGRGMNRVRSNMSPANYHIEPPILVAVEFITTEMADKASLLPGSNRLDGERIQFTAADMVTAYRSFRAAVALAQV
jgi:D-amino peptidase